MANKSVKEEEKIDIKKLEKDLKKYIDSQLVNNSSNELEKSNRRFIRGKNTRLFFKNITIIVLLLIIGLLVYLLYKEDFFDKYFCNNKCVNETIIIDANVSEENTTVKELSLDELIDKYSNLLDKVIISEGSIYIKDFYDGKLSQELKNYLAISQLNFNDFEIEEDYNIIDENNIKSSYEKIFNDEYNNISFDYDGNKVRYFSKLNSYVSDSLLKKSSSNIKREIINIRENDNKVIISTVEGIVKDNKLYDINNNEIGDYKKNSLNYYKDKLSNISYTFENGYLIKID